MKPETAKALEGLQEIGLPPAVSYMPQTIGWYVLLAMLVAALGVLAWRWRRSWVKNRYRREALAELAQLEQTSDVAALPELMKRVALASSPRESVAALSGDAWLRFLNETGGSQSFSQGAGRLLPAISYGSVQTSEAEKRDLFEVSRQWIKRHRARI